MNYGMNFITTYSKIKKFYFYQFKTIHQMKKIPCLLLGVITLLMAAAGCQQSKPMDDMAIQHRSDSVYNARKVMLMDSMTNDCQTNMGAMVQMKADSIYRTDSASMAMAHK